MGCTNYFNNSNGRISYLCSQFIKMKYWKIWCKALGEKSGTTDRQSDGIAFVRTLLVLQAIITNLFIVANIIRTWYG